MAAGPRDFLAVNVTCAVCWVVVAILAGRAYARRAEPLDGRQRQEAAAAPPR
jgi:membrane protein DedA with SNARE-associated domain